MRLYSNVYDTFSIGHDRTCKIKNIVDHYITRLELDVDELERMNPVSKACHLLVLSEMYQFLAGSEEKWDHIIYLYMDSIRNDIYKNKLGNRLSLFGGLADVAFAVYSISSLTGNFGKFLDSLNKLIADVLLKQIHILKQTPLDTGHYDIILGVSGVLNYLLCTYTKEEKIDMVLKEAIMYLSDLCEFKIIDDNYVPGWYTKSYKSPFREGMMTENFNYSLSHGIAGVLVVLARSLKLNIIEPKFSKSVKIVLQEMYKQSILEPNGCYYWHGRFYISDYLKEKKPAIEDKRMSWCYGSPGILRAMHVAAQSVHDEYMLNFCKDAFLSLVNLPIQEYGFASPTICHGYSGMLMVLKEQYHDTPDEKIHNSIIEITDIILRMYSKNSRYGYFGKEGIDEDDSNSLLEGAAGVVLILISMLKKETVFQKHFAI